MNEKQITRYEDGSEVDLGYPLAEGGRFRINICQGQSEPRMICRHIPEEIPSLKSLNLPPILEKIALSPRGLVLVTGATGSGKSTTLAGMIDLISRSRSCHIVTIEDPIEFSFKDRKSIVTQREVGQDTSGFQQALKYSLRQDPDVILVGEMRDEETMLMAITAAATGHLVLTTLHTIDAKETINRILSTISNPAMQQQVRLQLATQLVAIISQRLLVTKDGKGRVAAMEILLHNHRVQELLSDPKKTYSLKDVMEQSRSIGMQSFDQSLMDLYKQGRITKEEAIANCSNPRDFQLRLQGIMPGEWTKQESEVEEEAEPQAGSSRELEPSISEKIYVEEMEPTPKTNTQIKRPPKEEPQSSWAKRLFPKK